MQDNAMEHIHNFMNLYLLFVAFDAFLTFLRKKKNENEKKMKDDNGN